MEYSITFENGVIAINQTCNGYSSAVRVDLETVPKLNVVLEAAKLPNLYQWASYGLELQPLLQLITGCTSVSIFADEHEISKDAKVMIETASVNLTGKHDLGTEFLAIIQEQCSKYSDEKSTGLKAEIGDNWEQVYQFVMNGKVSQ